MCVQRLDDSLNLQFTLTKLDLVLIESRLLPTSSQQSHILAVTIQSVVATGGVNSSLMSNSYRAQSPARHSFKRLPKLLSQGYRLVDYVSVARVRPRTSKGITDLLLPNFILLSAGSFSKKTEKPKLNPTKKLVCLFSKIRSRSLSELTRQITPRTKNGHAPPPIKSRKSFQSVNPSYVWTW
ncbi:hypothetical protein PHYBLDRAFT_171033 [Phycomyces blakesleeanus NRRL 1555(-)]|uniref:Uncharacterized protein n=1 Tax=Phycomyces blakesleeanus (strain ATCC 8743b / DSM 1359 / FGSC 10004 / NBRC 33097 / NRRL 1555) TaxID=763407 RepID=A0A162TZ03_PHYB8|nr:hypothetical protein PHYBLDRAFT_171033 [Phycomyces blakesleeanus NRRL 1555(-)]OAD70963.1 hypothetical protein PHYBLDRAFT_171033 [Phycomyces blakesleeanus NRRL 1555(-)]|eukprot:XP_018289003.1 hypothetical protein PHYBLDRAFT_171033 [Phycomyces blakesleeanus NRRL 1555(-)]